MPSFYLQSTPCGTLANPATSSVSRGSTEMDDTIDPRVTIIKPASPKLEIHNSRSWGISGIQEVEWERREWISSIYTSTVHRPVLEAWLDGSADLPPVQWKAGEAGGTPGKSQCWMPRAQLLHVDLPDHQVESRGGVQQLQQMLTTQVSDLWIEMLRIYKDVNRPGELEILCSFMLNTPTYRGHKGIKKVLCTSPEGHVVGQLGAEDWNRGNRAGQSDGQRTVQTARVESDVWDTWRTVHDSKYSSFINLFNFVPSAKSLCAKLLKRELCWGIMD